MLVVLLLNGCLDTASIKQENTPSVEIVSPTDLQGLYADVPVLLHAEISDNEDSLSDLQINWESSIDGALDVDLEIQSDDVEGALLLTQGEHVLTITVEDLDGYMGTDTVTVTVGEANRNPLCELLSPSSQSVFSSNDTVLFTASASDPDVAVERLTGEWSSDIDGVVAGGSFDSDGVHTLQTSALSWNDHEITFTVTDEVGAVCTASTAVFIGSVPNNNHCQSVGDWSMQWEAMEEEVLRLTNQLRSQGTSCGGEYQPPVGPLVMQRNLRCSSRLHSVDMVERNFFAHTNPSGVDPGTRIEQAGYNWNTYGENIAAGYQTAQQVFDGWHDSPGHCSNMMSDWFTEIGIGYYDTQGYPYWTQNFGAR